MKRIVSMVFFPCAATMCFWRFDDIGFNRVFNSSVIVVVSGTAESSRNCARAIRTKTDELRNPNGRGLVSVNGLEVIPESTDSIPGTASANYFPFISLPRYLLLKWIIIIIIRRIKCETIGSQPEFIMQYRSKRASFVLLWRGRAKRRNSRSLKNSLFVRFFFSFPT